MQREIVVSDGFAERRYEAADAIITLCNDASFWSNNMDKLRLYLKPLKALIRLFDHDTHTTEHLYPGMYDVQQLLAETRRVFQLRSAATVSVSTRLAGSG